MIILACWEYNAPLPMITI